MGVAAPPYFASRVRAASKSSRTWPHRPFARFRAAGWYVGTTINTPAKDLTFGACLDFIKQVDIGAVETGYFTSYSGYASFNVTGKLAFNGRAEYAEGLALGAMTTTTAFDKVIALAGTVQYDLWTNVVTRLEVRWDHAADGTTPFGGTIVGAPDKKNEVSTAASVTYKF